MMDTTGLEQVPTAPPRVDTPLGAVTFAVTTGTSLPAKPTTAWRLANGTVLHRWRRREADVELLLGPIDAQENNATLWAAVWQVIARDAVPGIEITAGLTALFPDVEGGPSSGENLDAVTLEHATAVVSIGGPDADFQHHQAGTELPARWAPLFGWGGEYGARYVDDRTLCWKLPDLAVSETAELAIAVAWTAPPEHDDHPTTWFAVDLPRGYAHEQLTA